MAERVALRLDLDEALPYLAALVIITTGLWVVATGGEAPAFFAVGVLFALLASWLSWSQRNEPAGLPTILRSTLPFVGLIVADHYPVGGLLVVTSAESMTVFDTAIQLAGHLMMAAVALCFLFRWPSLMLFAIVPVMAAFGLVAGRVPDGVLILAFSIFLFSSLFQVSHDHLMTRRRVAADRASPGRAQQRRGLRSQLLLAVAGIGAATLLLGGLLSLPMISLGGRYRALLESSPSPGLRGEFGGGLFEAAEYRVGQGPVRLSDRRLFTVESDSAELWRAQVYERYVGDAWRMVVPRRSVSFTREQLDRTPDLRAYLPVEQGGRRVLNQVVEFEAPLPLRIYAAGQPYSVWMLDATPPGLRFRLDAAGVLTSNAQAHPGTRYRVHSVVGELKSPLPAARMPPLPPEYLEVRAWEAPRLVGLARELTRNINDPVQKVLTLREELWNRCRYSLKARAIPRGVRDAAEYFLFEQKVGYCDLFATALTLMARAAGVPARFVTGYQGDYDEKTERFVVRESDAHAWTEVYLRGRGWVDIEVTPPGETGGMSPVQRALLIRKVAGGIGLALLTAAAVFGVTRLLRRGLWFEWPAWLSFRRRAPGPEGKSTDRLREAVLRAYARMNRLLGRWGMPRAGAQTPDEYLANLSSPRLGLEGCLAPLRNLTHLFVLARYSSREVTGESAAAAEAAWSELRRKLRRVRRPGAV
jgi:transglutaminase-like putative cysteine protease